MSSSENATAIVNASPLICLARAGLINILFGVFPNVSIPRAVLDDVLAGPEDDHARLFLQQSQAYSIIEPTLADELIRDWDLGAGETSVLTCVLESTTAIAIIDDAAARKCARTLNIPYCGSLGVLAKARQAGIALDLSASILALQESGLYLTQTVVDRLKSLSPMS